MLRCHGEGKHQESKTDSDEPEGIQGQPSPGCEGGSNVEAVGTATHVGHHFKNVIHKIINFLFYTIYNS